MTPETLFVDKSILLVEDDISLADRLLDYFGVLGCKDVLYASNLISAQTIVDSSSVDLAVLDVQLSENDDSIDLGKGLAEQGVRVIFMSGYNREDMAIRTRGFEFVEKPLSLPRLKAALQRALLRNPPDFVSIDDTGLSTSA